MYNMFVMLSGTMVEVLFQTFEIPFDYGLH